MSPDRRSSERSLGGFVRCADRGQLVLVAAAAIALALFPMALAYLQLGYAGDVSAEPTTAAPAAELDRALDRVAVDGTRETAGEYAWDDRQVAIEAYRDAIADELDGLETARLEDGVVAEVEYAAPAAENVADGACPGGDQRAFGPCEAHDGVVVQERAGETVVVAVAFDLTVSRTDGVTELQVVVDLG